MPNLPVDRRLLAENPAARNLLYASVGLGALAAGLWLALAWLLSSIVNRVFIGKQGLSDVTGLLAIAVALMLARVFLMWGSDVVAQRSANRVKSELRAGITRTLWKLGPLYTRGERTGELVHAATQGIETLDEYMSQFQPARLLAGLVPALVFVVIAVLDPLTLPILLFTGPILLLLLALIGRRTSDLTARRFLEMSWMSAHFMDVLQGLETLKLFGRSKEQAKTIETISQHYGNATMDVLRTAFQTSLVLEWGATAATALVAIEVSVRLMNGLLPFELALTVLLLTPEFFLPLRTLAMRYHAGTTGKAAAERIYEILDTPSSIVALESADAPQPPLPARLDLTFDDVYVAFENGARPALNGFSLRWNHGETIALVGETGAGKTTIANLLLRYVEPTRGRILVGDVPLSNYAPEPWRTIISAVAQHPYLFEGTVAENLRLARRDGTRDELVQAAQAANAHEFIERLPQGYETALGEHGARLSGGQRQRLAIARAFLKDAPLLVLDEATSHLDAKSEELVREALGRLMRNRTTLVIAHRLTMAYDADRVIVMREGRVVEQGSPRVLLARDGRLAELATAFEGGAA